MKLVSDFRDYYDLAFDGTGQTFVRNAKGSGPSKREQFVLLQQARCNTPPHGLFSELIGQYWPSEDTFIERCVVYDDETLHCGEGKRMSRRDMDEFDRSAGKYASAFVGDPNANGVSWRRLQVGRHVFWIEYKSNESWMSNVGEGSCEVFECEYNAGYHPFFDLPLFAIDFVLGKEMYAVDLNIAPGIRGSGVEKLIDSYDVVKEIELWHKENS